MSENLEELLDIPDEENEGDYDLGDDEEEALLDENYEINKTHSTTQNTIQNTTEPEQDVLDLDDGTELNDEDSENLNTTTEEEGRIRQDKFSSERIVPQKEPQIFVKKFKSRNNPHIKPAFRGNFNNNRGNRIGNRGNFHNNQNRTLLHQQRNKVLINPHFKGNVQIRHNVSLAWDKNNPTSNTGHRKPVIHIQPWAQHPPPQPVQYQQNPMRQDVNMNQQYQPPVQNSRLPVHQRLVVSNETMNVDVPYFEQQETKYLRVRKYIDGSPTKRKFDFKNDLKKKKRTVLSSNLHEVETVDIKVFEDRSNMLEDEDEEMKQYRKKIEHQKRMRETLLRQKEERRKQAARKLQVDEKYKSLASPTDTLKEEIPVITNLNKSINTQVTKQMKKHQIVRVNKTIVPIKTIDAPIVIKRVVTAKPMSCEKNVPAEFSESETLNKDQLTSFLSNRKIFAKDKSLIDTSLVVINNIATGTSEVKLRKLCQGVGDIQVRVVND